MLSELEALTEGLLQQARASHHPALDLSLRTSDARRAAQQLTRRMMAAVSELSLYQVGRGTTAVRLWASCRGSVGALLGIARSGAVRVPRGWAVRGLFRARLGELLAG
jgi:hypothetical protein